jgi:hypothetical protein
MDAEVAPQGDRRRWSAWRCSRPKGTTTKSASSGSRCKLLSDKGSTVLCAERRWVRRPATGACRVQMAMTASAWRSSLTTATVTMDFGQDFERRLDTEQLFPALSGRKEWRRCAPLLGRRRCGGLNGVGVTGCGDGGGGAVGFGQRRGRPVPLCWCMCDGQHRPARLISRRHVAV